uniref:Uncharacterized protein n=1 Tax=Leersia perrieri TaxID=77586 RepID=A0A0D9X789_9ORYZ
MASMKQPGYRLPPKHLFGKLIKDFTTTMRFLCKSSFTSGPQTCKEWQPYHPFNHACAALEEGLPGSPGQSLRRLPHRFKELQQVLKTKLRDSMAAVIRNASRILMDAFVDSTFTFSHQSLRPTESNFAPVEEIGERTEVFEIEGAIPEDFPEGVYIRNGSNPFFGDLHMVNSIFGHSEDIWVEGEGMLHAIYFTKSREGNTWSVSYNNRYVQSDTFRMERECQRPRFLPSAKGDNIATMVAGILNKLRFGKGNRNYSNTNVFQHAGRVFSSAENDNPHEIDLENLGTLCSWDVGGDWNMPFTAHPKVQHYHGYASYNGPKLFDYDAESYARLGVMPRYGDADSVIWFDVEPFCTFHLVNCFEEDDEVVVMRGFRIPGSILTGPTLKHTADEEPANQGLNEEYFSRLYEWRLNLKSRAVTEKYLTGTDVALEFPVINDKYVGLPHKYAYAQVVDAEGSMAGGCGIVRPKFGGFAKLHLEDKIKSGQDLIDVEYHSLGRNKFCSGATFVAKFNGANEDDGWIISFAHIIDAQRFENGPREFKRHQMMMFLMRLSNLHTLICYPGYYQVVVRGFHLPNSAIMGSRKKEHVHRFLQATFKNKNEETFSLVRKEVEPKNKDSFRQILNWLRY